MGERATRESRLRILDTAAAPALAMALLLAGGCIAGFRTQAEYEWKLGSMVSRSSDGSAPWTSLTVAQLAAEDADCSFTFTVQAGRIGVTVENRGAATLSLVPEGARHVDEDGVSRALHLASEHWDEPPVTEVPVGKRATLFVWPRAWLRSDHEGRSATWRSDSPLDGDFLPSGGSRKEAAAKGRGDIGRTFTLVIALRMGAEERLYRFAFTVDGAGAEVIGWA